MARPVIFLLLDEAILFGLGKEMGSQESQARLDNAGWKQPVNQLLAQVKRICDATGADIALGGRYRQAHGGSFIGITRWFLSLGLPLPLYWTPCLTDLVGRYAPRCAEIWACLYEISNVNRNGGEMPPYVILDDHKNSEFGHQGRLVLCDPATGLTEGGVMRAILVLKWGAVRDVQFAPSELPHPTRSLADLGFQVVKRRPDGRPEDRGLLDAILPGKIETSDPDVRRYGFSMRDQAAAMHVLLDEVEAPESGPYPRTRTIPDSLASFTALQEKLAEKIRAVDVTKYSVELQDWWQWYCEVEKLYGPE